MIHDRSINIPLAPDEPRCEPSTECVARGRCARYMAFLPRGGQPIDYSEQPNGGTVLCAGFFLLQHVLTPAPRRRAERSEA